jgi:endonuclease G
MKTGPVLGGLLAAACASDVPAQSPRGPAPGHDHVVNVATAAGSVHALLGVPTDGDASDDALLDEAAFLVSYNPRRRAANWVAWRLEASDMGHLSRHALRFRPDPGLPDGVYRVTSRDYTDSGYDRGHLCPFADRNGDAEVGARTFLLTNTTPQRRELNSGPWEKLETYERVRASAPGATLFIVAGGVFDDHPPTIGHGVSVPRSTFKIVVALEKGQGPGDVTPATPTVAVEMPNERDVLHRDWQDFVTSIDRVERDTGYDFLSAVPVDVQAVLESRAPREL